MLHDLDPAEVTWSPCACGVEHAIAPAPPAVEPEPPAITSSWSLVDTGAKDLTARRIA